MELVAFTDIKRCAVCGRCRTSVDFPPGASMCYFCFVEQVTWCSPWFLDADELAVTVDARPDFAMRQLLMRHLLQQYFAAIHFPLTRFQFDGEIFEPDYARRHGFRPKARGFDMTEVSGRELPYDAEQTIRLLLRSTLTKVIRAVEALNDDDLDLDPVETGLLYFGEVGGDYLELLYLTGTLHEEDELRDHLYAIMDLICDH